MMIVRFCGQATEDIASGADDGTYSKMDLLIKRKKVPFVRKDLLKVLTVLKTANTCSEIPKSYKPHPLHGNKKGWFAVDIPGQGRNMGRKKLKERGLFRLVFRPTDPSSYKDGDHNTINDITIVELITNYH